MQGNRIKVETRGVGRRIRHNGQYQRAGESQKKLDIISNEILKTVLLNHTLVAGVASEEESWPVPGNKDGRFLVLFDPLDGSSNIDVNVSVGTIFSILEAPEGEDFSTEQPYSIRPQTIGGWICFIRPISFVSTHHGPRCEYVHPVTYRRFLANA